MKHPTYSPHPSIGMVQDWVDSLKAKTGRSLDEWLAFIEKKGPKEESSRRTWLKDELKLGTNTAWWLAERSVGKGLEDADPKLYLKAAKVYVEEMYAKKPLLVPAHDAAMALIADLNKETQNSIRICPGKTIIPFYREHVFAQLRPATRTRLDLGLALGPLIKQNKKFPARLADTGGFAKKDRITHAIGLSKPDDVDAEVKLWLRRAYELDAP